MDTCSADRVINDFNYLLRSKKDVQKTIRFASAYLHNNRIKTNISMVHDIGKEDIDIGENA